MPRYVLQRLAVAVPLLLVATLVVFVLVSVSTDPLGSLKSQTPPVGPRVIAAQSRRLHLDESILPRYGNWLDGLVHGTWGPSVNATTSIGHEIVARLGTTLLLIGTVVVLALVLSLAAGTLSAVRQGGVSDRVLTVLAVLFIAMPSFWFAVLLKQGGIQLNHAVGHTVIYTIGSRSVVESGSTLDTVGDVVGHLVLPVLALALLAFGVWSRYLRAAMAETLHSDYVRFARAKGIPWRSVVLHHALRNALLPLVTVSALDLAALIGGSVVVEEVFQWQGMGDFLIKSIQAQDVYAIQAWLVVFAVAVVAANLAADLSYAALDPRIRHA